MILFRASSVGKLMASPEKNTLPAGAITELDKMISQQLLNWRDEMDFLELQKGIHCENESIELYNERKDTFYTKNVDRIYKDTSSGLIIDHDTGLIFDRSQPVLTGECDILDKNASLVIDIKTSYSKKSHPLNLKASKLYEWQLRAYMYLYDVDHAELAYCLVDTPHEFRRKFEHDTWHEMHDVDDKYKLSTLIIKRDLEKEQQLLNRIKLCKKYVEENLK